jgi:hypothetical protein
MFGRGTPGGAPVGSGRFHLITLDLRIAACLGIGVLLYVALLLGIAVFLGFSVRFFLVFTVCRSLAAIVVACAYGGVSIWDTLVQALAAVISRTWLKDVKLQSFARLWTKPLRRAIEVIAAGIAGFVRWTCGGLCECTTGRDNEEPTKE